MKLPGFKTRKFGGFRPKTKRAAKAAAVSRSLTTNQKKEVKKLVNGVAQTKMAVWYSGGTNPLGVGSRSNFAWEAHNGQIASNTTDIMRLIPYVVTGDGDNNRIGERISPTGLVVKGNVKFNYTNVTYQQAPQNYFVVIYVLQHVALKTYDSLQSATTTPPTKGNEFSQLLKTGEGDTVGFGGLSYQADLPVADEYYRLLAKKVIPLRTSGIVPAPTGASAGPSLQSFNNNSHQLCARYTFNLSKKIPKILKYQETAVTTGQVGDPTNSSIFMCLGFYSMDYDSTVSAANVSNEYVSIMTYKDL